MPTLTPRGVEAAVAEPDDSCFVPIGNGAALATDVYLPAQGSTLTSFPTLLLRTPYGRRGEIDRVRELSSYFREAGIAVVVQDVRGRYDSSGELTPFVHELVDAHTTLEWVASRSWSDGAIFPFGDSYAGFTAWAAAASGHSAVRGAIVRVTTPEIGPHWMYRDGMFRLQMNAQWAAFAWGDARAIDVQPEWGTRPLRAIDFADADLTALAVWLEAGAHEDRWRSVVGDVSSRWCEVSVPVLHWGGWWDLMSRGQIAAWQRLASRGTAGQRLVMEATDHSFNRFPPGGVEGASSLEGQYRQVAAWVASTLGHPEPTSIRYEVAHGDWKETDRWPPSRSTERLFLVDARSALYGPEGGALSTQAETVPSTVRWSHDPDDLVPSLESFVWATLASAYPDERDVQVRDDVVTFTGLPVAEPLEIAGVVRLRLELGSSSRVSQVAAALSDVRPDGTAWRIAEGVAAPPGEAEPASFELDLGPLAYRVVRGHRLRVALAASSFPRYLWACRDPLAAWNGELSPEYELSLRLGSNSYLEVSVHR